MADALLSIVLDRLASVIQEQIHHEVSMVVGVESEIESLTRTLRTVRAVVADAEKRQVKEERVKIWLESLKDIASQMGDVLDEWRAAVLKSQIQSVESPSMTKKKVCSSYIPSPCICFKRVSGRRDIALKIKGIKQQVEDIANQRNQFDFTSISYQEPQRLITVSAVDISQVYGRDMDRDTILRQLLGESCEQKLGLYIISVVGMGGVGKTTLAQLAFNHHEVRAHFDKRIWVCVSDPFVPIRIFRAILEALQGPSDLHDPQALQQQIGTCIDGKKFLLVLDDVWTEDYQLWEQLENCLKCGAGGSRILVTTRNESVAKIMTSTYVHCLRSLSLDQSRALFSQIAFFRKGTKKAEEFKEISEKIVDKCKGLPLAVKALASLMQTKDNKEDWENVLNSEMWEHVFEKNLSPALLLSYYDLPPALKRCFSYCAVFPKDHFIERDDLIKLWMAQSYLNSKAGREMETIGREYFENLATRSFFQDFKKDVEGNIVSCKMHDIVHDLAQFLINNECLILEDDDENLKMNLPLRKCRHATLIVSGSARFSFSFNNVGNLHTLLVVANKRFYRIDPWLPDSSQHFKYLRAMDLRRNDSIVKLPREVGEFIQLRYLNLSHCGGLITLPETISDLCNLQTLNIRYCWRLVKLPQGIRNLINLRHLEMDWEVLRILPKGVGRLTSLRTLSDFAVCNDEDASEGCKIEELGNLKELRELKIRGLGRVEDAGEVEKAELKNKKRLHYLTLSFLTPTQVEGMKMKHVAEALQPPPNLKSLCVEWYWCPEWPNWIIRSSLTQLKHLELSHCHCECLPPLGELPLLESLKIDNMIHVKYVGAELLGSSSAIAFPMLKHLSFIRMGEWEKWEVEEEKGRKVMPCLRSLKLTSCPKLAVVPDHLLRRTPPLELSIINVFGCDSSPEGL